MPASIPSDSGHHAAMAGSQQASNETNWQSRKQMEQAVESSAIIGVPAGPSSSGYQQDLRLQLL